jgi:hypothetical protein
VTQPHALDDGADHGLLLVVEVLDGFEVETQIVLGPRSSMSKTS